MCCKKFKADIEFFGKYPDRTPKHRLAMMQILIMKLVDLLDEPDDHEKLIIRDFRTTALTPVSVKQEEYLAGIDRHVEKLKIDTLEHYVEEVNKVAVLQDIEEFRLEREAARKAGNALEDDEEEEGGEGGASRDPFNFSGYVKRLTASFLSKTKSGYKRAGEGMTPEELTDQLDLSRNMTIIERYNVKAAELHRMKEAQKYRQAVKEVEKRKSETKVPKQKIFQQMWVQLDEKRGGNEGAGARRSTMQHAGDTVMAANSLNRQVRGNDLSRTSGGLGRMSNNKVAPEGRKNA